jgi:Ser/Thr protein kinase RdoA (MazF antagonist)
VPAKSGEELVQQMTPWGEFYASVFKGVDGVPLEETGLKDDVAFTYGASLGQLHQLSSQFRPQATIARTHNTLLDWMEETLHDLGKEGPVLDEIEMLRNFFSGMPRDNDSYGLIHYDFELDNVFYDENTHTCSVIDFDDAMLHWYGMDIVQALDSLERETDKFDFPKKKLVFLEGYKSRYAINEEWTTAIPAFRRYGDLVRYTRIARSIQEEWENEPDWMQLLRKKLSTRMIKYASVFGTPL